VRTVAYKNLKGMKVHIYSNKLTLLNLLNAIVVCCGKEEGKESLNKTWKYTFIGEFIF
jgi:hypothetical protein